MKSVKILTSFFVAKKSSRFVKGWQGEVSDDLAERHGENGTGFLKVLSADEVKPKLDLKKDKK